tara:strand:- start:519 stop:2897 length:2379 start_codon:yes stop_codon:yes gene_type:complete
MLELQITKLFYYSKRKTIMTQSKVLLVILLLLVSPTFTAASPNQEVMHPNIMRAMDAADAGAEIEFIVQYRPHLTETHMVNANAIGIEIISVFEFIDGFYGKGTSEEIKTLSKEDDIFWIEHNSQMEYYMQDTTRVIEAVETWQTVIIDENENVIKDQTNQHTYIDGTGVAAVIIDTGVDAGHPDFDYDEGKTVSYKFDRATRTWVEAENSDTSSGHGTHCAGTVGGNGDAAAGAKKGVAPGATLVGMGVGDIAFIDNAVEAFQWVYDNSRPEANPLNIRVTSNSWGSSGSEYDPSNAISQAVFNLQYDNNVVSVFAAGNSGGDGSDLQTNPYSNIPLVIGVAALEHDGSGIASFSSRGDMTKPQTWPDIGAPGVNIWATAPRATLIDILQRPSDDDLYYMAISGTSMATPHIAGVATLLYQAAPSLGVANYFYEDHETTEGEWYGNRTDTFVSEVELILELSGRYIEGGQSNANDTVSNTGLKHDWGQGHGLIDTKYAVQMALTLESLRNADEDEDGILDNEMVTVFDARNAMLGVSHIHKARESTDSLKAEWKGEWAYFVGSEGTYVTDSTHYLHVPEGTISAEIVLTYPQVNTDRFTVADLELSIDTNSDGTNDVSQSVGTNTNAKEYTIVVDESSSGHLWVFGIEGTAVGVKPTQGATLEEFWEPRVPYDVNVRLIMEPGIHFVDENLTNYGDYACSTDGVNMNTHNQACISKLEFGEPSASYDGSTIIEMNFNAFNLSRLQMEVETIQEVEDTFWTISNVAILAGAGGFVSGAVMFVFWARRPFAGN